MKTQTLAFMICMLFFAASHAAVLPDSCGNDAVHFDVKAHKNATLPEPPAPGFAQIVFLETRPKVTIQIGAQPPVRIGIDGVWSGALKDDSYFVANVPAGIHHLCGSWQAHLPKNSPEGPQAMSITVEAGKRYFVEFAFVSFPIHDQPASTVTFAPVNDDQGAYYMKTYALATWTSKH